MSKPSDADSTGEMSAVSVSDAVIVRTPQVDRAREMYRRFLASEYPEALVIAEEVLKDRPDDFMALAIVNECRQARDSHPASGAPGPSSSDGPITIPSPPPAPRDSEPPTAETAVDLTAAYLGVGPRGDRGRQMCQRFLESDHPAALALAEELLSQDPEDRMARAIAEQCRAALDEVAAGTLSAESLDLDVEDL
jgi:hypothetical protein